MPWGRPIQQSDIKPGLYIHVHGVRPIKETTLTSLADLQIGSQLTKDYSVMITSRPVLEQVIEKQGLNLTYDQLKERITDHQSRGYQNPEHVCSGYGPGKGEGDCGRGGQGIF